MVLDSALYRLFWLAKRLMPNTFYRVVGWMYRNKLGLPGKPSARKALRETQIGCFPASAASLRSAVYPK